jgi:hypothetical protein
MGPSEKSESFEERHFTVPELAAMWHLSKEFVRQVIQDEPGVTEWVRQQPGRRRYRVLRVPQSVAERVYQRALGRAGQHTVLLPPVRKRRRGPLSAHRKSVALAGPNDNL